jgi:hypothetical protein
VSGNYPVVSYWKQTSIVSDNRIPAGGSDSSNYTFLAPPAGEEVRLFVELRFRRLFDEFLSAKDWGSADVIMEQANQLMQVSPWWEYYMPIATAR